MARLPAGRASDPRTVSTGGLRADGRPGAPPPPASPGPPTLSAPPPAVRAAEHNEDKRNPRSWRPQRPRARKWGRRPVGVRRRRGARGRARQRSPSDLLSTDPVTADPGRRPQRPRTLPPPPPPHSAARRGGGAAGGRGYPGRGPTRRPGAPWAGPRRAGGWRVWTSGPGCSPDGHRPPELGPGPRPPPPPRPPARQGARLGGP